MAYINEYGEIIREKDPNDKSKVSLTFFEVFFVFIYNYMLLIPGIVLYYNHRKKGYTRKAKQVGVITAIEAVLFILIFIIAASG